MDKLNIKALGLAMGIVWGGGILILGLMALYLNWGMNIVTLIGSVYLGYNSTLGGILIGTIWGFCDGAIGGVLFAWLYNKLCG